MRRRLADPRPNWQQLVEREGLVYHSMRDDQGRFVPYWNESAYYSFEAREIDHLERVTEELHEMSVAAAQHVVAHGRCRDFGIPPWVDEAIARSLKAEPPTLYGRFDLAFDGSGPAKLLEYNADTPTALIEAAITQWNWLRDVGLDGNQCNSLHERLVAAWRVIKRQIGPRLALAYMPDELGEDASTVAYLADTAAEAGLEVHGLTMDQLGYLPGRHVFTLADGVTELPAIFALYPWEWMLTEQFGPLALAAECRTAFIEPVWKMLLSNKALLAVLWELFPGHPHLLPAYLDGPRDLRDYVRKPLLGREGASIEIVRADQPSHRQPGPYGAEGFVYQQYHRLAEFSGKNAVIGSWVVAGRSAGIGVRESTSLVTDEWAQFCPHVIDAPEPLADQRARCLAEPQRPYPAILGRSS
ncbi:MAG: glutathionylspermidine synthase family protein [Angustibacter sp.]